MTPKKSRVSLYKWVWLSQDAGVPVGVHSAPWLNLSQIISISGAEVPPLQVLPFEDRQFWQLRQFYELLLTALGSDCDRRLGQKGTWCDS